MTDSASPPVHFPVDVVIVSSNEYMLYLDFWPHVAWAYRALFPGVRVLLAFVSERHDDDPLIDDLRRHGEVEVVRPARDVPQAAQCKLARYWVAARRGAEVCYVDDIDWIPIDAEWHASKVRPRKLGSLLLVGSEVYGNGLAPASQMTAEGDVFKALFNPDGLSFDDYLGSLVGRPGHANVRSRAQHEGIDCTTSQESLGEPLFSDEALVAALRAERPVAVSLVERGYVVGRDTIDRSCWSALDPARLEAGGYIGAHTGRPYAECRSGNDLILDYIENRYSSLPRPDALDPKLHVSSDMQFSAISRSAFEWICANVPRGASVLEVGSAEDSTNYLSRYYWTSTITCDSSILNIFPSYYIYAPMKDEWYDVEQVLRGFRCYGPYGGRYRLTVVTRAALPGIERHLNIIDLRAPVLVADGDDIVVLAIAAATGREPQRREDFVVI